MNDLKRAGFLAFFYMASPPAPLLQSANCFSFSVFLCVADRAYWWQRVGRGWEGAGSHARKLGPLEIIWYSLQTPSCFMFTNSLTTWPLFSFSAISFIPPLSYSWMFILQSWEQAKRLDFYLYANMKNTVLYMSFLYPKHIAITLYKDTLNSFNRIIFMDAVS